MEIMTEEFEARFIKPIINAAYPATLASLSLVTLQVTYLGHPSTLIRILLVLGGVMFLVTSVAVFFYTVYPTRRRLWTVGATTFLLGLLYMFVATALVVII